MKEIKKWDGGILYYDGGCGFCVRWVVRVRGLMAARGVAVVPFEDGAAEPEMRLRWANGVEVGGADVVFAFAERVWWARPMVWAGRFEWVRAGARAVYRGVAARRTCALPRVERRGIGWVAGLSGGLAAVAAAWFGSAALPIWGWRWILAGGLFYVSKGVALMRVGGAMGWRRVFAFLFLWPGMDAGEMAGGANEVASWVAGGIGLFWAIRVVIQWAYYDQSHWLGGAEKTAVHWILTVCYGGCAAGYLVAAF